MGLKIVGESGESYPLVDSSVETFGPTTQGRVLDETLLHPAQLAASIVTHMPYMRETDPAEYDVERMLEGVVVLAYDDQGEVVPVGEGIGAVRPLHP